jgi:hypothetical protein
MLGVCCVYFYECLIIKRGFLSLIDTRGAAFKKGTEFDAGMSAAHAETDIAYALISILWLSIAAYSCLALYYSSFPPLKV